MTRGKGPRRVSFGDPSGRVDMSALGGSPAPPRSLREEQKEHKEEKVEQEPVKRRRRLPEYEAGSPAYEQALQEANQEFEEHRSLLDPSHLA